MDGRWGDPGNAGAGLVARLRRRTYSDFDGAIAVDFPGDVKWPAAALCDGEPALLVRLEGPDCAWVRRVLEGLGDGRERLRSVRI